MKLLKRRTTSKGEKEGKSSLVGGLGAAEVICDHRSSRSGGSGNQWVSERLVVWDTGIEIEASRGENANEGFL